ncbi:hypothetical protein KR51_00008510 [Rubidibacter lacunae KORDI 51-2]|uniref:Uncharacterized protein n=1 Tax=Rubidibacter lacunae KORDI 51-2 TaxID=582515 RepID=U5DLI4_9CHRO|nr:hypothetical protein [Rubidibacter lacunae]ERN42531.1 hypothetical protein KR51_00008510 [Rubidibacter lacunae KORDI 51-2]
MKKLLLGIATLGLGVAVPKPAIAAPIQCYIDNDGSYQVCDLQTQGPSQFMLTWPDGERTAIVENQTQSGSWVEVRHINVQGQSYGGGVRYPKTHFEQGEWLCYHELPGGQGSIDFCLTP